MPALKRIDFRFGKGNTIYESEMALFSECMPWSARKVLDTADIVRDAILRQSTMALRIPVRWRARIRA